MSIRAGGGAEWQDTDHVDRYLRSTMPNAPAVAHTHEIVLHELVEADVRRVLDLGCGDGRLLALALEQATEATGVGVDCSWKWREMALMVGTRAA